MVKVNANMKRGTGTAQVSLDNMVIKMLLQNIWLSKA